MNPSQARLKSPLFQAQDRLLCLIARFLLSTLRALPFSLAASLGRIGGELFFWTDSRHRKVALRNLNRCFSKEKSKREIRRIARENFRRIGENFACSLKSNVAEFQALRQRVELQLPPGFDSDPGAAEAPSRIIAFGHFGNFEILARIPEFVPVYRGISTYRGVRHPALNSFLLSLRMSSGCKLFERRKESGAFKKALRSSGVLFGLAADQHAGAGAVQLPFLNHDCSTTKAPAVFARRFHHPLHAAVCHRVGKARWRIEVSEEIPTQVDGAPRSIKAIMADVNSAFERAVRLDPANWFWVHNRWKSSLSKEGNPV
jgi:lauroyl/myristoyl acyltransferase